MGHGQCNLGAGGALGGVIGDGWGHAWVLVVEGFRGGHGH